MFAVGANWIQAAIDFVLIEGFANPILFLMRICFVLFSAVAKVNIFNGDIYDQITGRMYAILSVAMLFVFAYQIILLIINPDGDTKSMSNLAKDTIISIILIILLPTIFNYASILQEHIISDNTIPAIILGTSGTSKDKAGNKLRNIMFLSFFKPAGTTYSTFYDEDGNFKDSSAQSDCESAVASHSNASSSNQTKICETYISGLKAGANKDNIIFAFAGRMWTLCSYDGNDGFECDALLLIGAAIYVTMLFLGYAIDLGTRAVKLFVLEIISPIPVVLRILPKSKSTFDKWLKEITKTYLEVFFRLAFIFLVIYLCGNVPTLVSSAMGSGWSTTHNVIVTIILILGICKFAKDAPEMLKKVFDSGGGWLSGIDFKPGVKRRVEENDYAMRGLNAASTGIGGAIGRHRVTGGFFKDADGNKTKFNFKRGMNSNLGAAAGFFTGAKNGLSNENRKLNLKNFTNLAGTGAQAAEDAATNFSNKFKRVDGAIDDLNPTNVVHPIDNLLFGGAFQQASIAIDQVNKDKVNQNDVDYGQKMSKAFEIWKKTVDSNAEIKKEQKEFDDAMANANEAAIEILKSRHQEVNAQTIADAKKEYVDALKAQHEEKRAIAMAKDEQIKQVSRTIKREMETYNGTYGSVLSDDVKQAGDELTKQLGLVENMQVGKKKIVKDGKEIDVDVLKEGSAAINMKIVGSSLSKFTMAKNNMELSDELMKLNTQANTTTENKTGDKK